jgi:hypothetical protein
MTGRFAEALVHLFGFHLFETMNRETCRGNRGH